jgi:tetratricopeptide (TPR) repeat protein
MRAWTVMTLILLLAASVARAQLQNDYRFQGKVVDQAGKPIPGAMITLHDPQTGSRIEIVTDAQGAFDRQNIPHGVYDATFAKEGYVTHAEHLDWSEVQPQTILKIAHIVLKSVAAQEASELGQKASQLYKEAYAALNANDCATAQRDARQLLALGAGQYEYAVRFVIARCLAHLNQLDQAQAEYDSVLALKPDLFEGHFDLAGLLERQGKHDPALQEFQKAAQLKPDDAETQYSIGAILLQDKQEFDSAKAYLGKAVQLAPDNAQAVKALGFANLWAEKKDIPEGVRLLEKYLELQPNAPDAGKIREIIKSFESTPEAKK